MEINTVAANTFTAKLPVQSVIAPLNSGDIDREELSSQTQALERSADREEQGEVELSDSQIEVAVEQISQFVQSNNRALNFSVDEATDRQVVKVTDAESGDIIRQIPSEEILRLSERLKDLQSDVGAVVGMLFNKQA